MRTTDTAVSSRTYHDAISERAHRLWHDRGCPEGQDVEIWLDAERELVREGAIPPAPPPRRKLAADEIDERELSDRLNDITGSASGATTSLDVSR